MNKLLLAALAGMVIAGSAQAQSASGKSPDQVTNSPYLGVGVTMANNTTSDGNTANLKLFGGFKLHDNWGVEAGFTHFGSRDFARNTGSQTVSGSTSGLTGYVAATYAVPVNDRFSLYGKLGLASSWRKYSNNLGVSLKDKDKGVYAALGAEYKLTDSLSLIGEYERQGKDKMSGAKADVWTAALKFGF